MEGRATGGHAYDNTTIQDSARAHLGDVYNHGVIANYNFHSYFACSASEHSSRLIPRSNEIRNEAGEMFPLKRKRSLDANEKRPSMCEETSLDTVLSKLGKFSKSIQDQRIGKDAKKVAQRIAAVINAVKRQVDVENNMKETHGYAQSSVPEDFDNIDDCLLVARRIDINTAFRRNARTKLVRATRRHNAVMFGSWSIYLVTTILESRDEDGNEISETLHSLCLEPRSPSAGQPVKVYFGERTNCFERSFLSPVVFAYRIVPGVSEVFKVIEKDDLLRLRILLEDGRTTIRDCDEENRSLLHSELDLFCAEGSAFFDLRAFREEGQSPWLYACNQDSSVTLLQKLQAEGCSAKETDEEGWNCLFHCVLSARGPSSSSDLERLRFLLSVFGDVDATDMDGRTIFDHVDSMADDFFRGYRRDLWYYALFREGIISNERIAQHTRTAAYVARVDFIYTPEHYHALKHLDSWDWSNFRSQMDRLLEEIPLSEEDSLEMRRIEMDWERRMEEARQAQGFLDERSRQRIWEVD
ncbi:hypothetical protein Q7P37_007278 [Cladosporium fusiforme]